MYRSDTGETGLVAVLRRALLIVGLIAITVISTSTACVAPVANFHASATKGDAPFVVTFTDDSTGGAAVWRWSFGDTVNSTDQNPVHTFKGGVYNVTLNISNLCGKPDNTTKFYYITAISGGSGHIAPPNMSFSFSQNVTYDMYNGTYFKEWLFNLTQYGDFNLYGLAHSIMAPFILVFGYWIFLMIWLTYLATVWIRSQDLTLPLVIGLISAGVWAVLIPAEAYLYIGVMFAVCIAAILVKLVWTQ